MSGWLEALAGHASTDARESTIRCGHCRKPLHDPVERFIELCSPCEERLGDLRADAQAEIEAEGPS